MPITLTLSPAMIETTRRALQEFIEARGNAKTTLGEVSNAVDALIMINATKSS